MRPQVFLYKYIVNKHILICLCFFIVPVNFVQAEAVCDQNNDSKQVLLFTSLLQKETNPSCHHLHCIEQSILAAEQLDDDYLRFRTNLHYARFLWQTSQYDDALNGYQEAFDALLRLDVSAIRWGALYTQTIFPAYQEYIARLFTVARQAPEARKQQLLRRVRHQMEHRYRADLANYFRDNCVEQYQFKQRDIEYATRDAVVIYPFILPDRLELLIHLPSVGFRQVTVDVDEGEVNAVINQFRRLLEKRTTHQYQRPAQQLYHWLIAPLDDYLARYPASTLVFIPSGLLRSVPFAALHSGQHFLIEQYPVAVAATLSLVDPTPLAIRTLRPVLLGVSEARLGFPALTNVDDELSAVQQASGGTLLLNQAFNREQLKGVLERHHPNLLHIATHGYFGRNDDESFLLTYGEKLSYRDLYRYLSSLKYRAEPLELIVLSACETARGDSQSALGLSGLAIRAGARSAVGSLWQVDDAATAQLMVAFYRHLTQPDYSRAKAMQAAQQGLLTHVEYRHPAYWSPFLMLNNWL